MVSLEESRSNSSRFPLPRAYQYHSSVSSKSQRHIGRSMRTIRSNFFQDDNSSTCSFTEKSTCLSENLTDSVVDLRLGELASRNTKSGKSSPAEEDLLDLSQAFSDFSACSSDISGELQRLATLPSPQKSDAGGEEAPELEPEPCMGTRAIEDGSVKGKEFAVLTLLQLCSDSVSNRGFLVREGGIPPLVALSQTGSVRAKHKAETLLRYLRESRQEASTSSS
uniref:U-box domain-containing protein 2 n=1 Tax=Cajanus cajan TaxID=3821 RepID=A0A151T6J2_CAJCA|nr:U-box domain-containing protein 2 [Cajanus cajan]